MLDRKSWILTAAALISSAALLHAGDSKTGNSKTGDSKKHSREKREAELKFIRVVRDAKKAPLALETATGHYISQSNGKPISVDLIGCIHVADRKYYQSLNERFKTYDAVLFELVIPEGESLGRLKDRESNHPVARVQQALPKILNLDYQLKDIDYTAKNFVHADLSPDEMAKAMKSRGDTGASVIFKVLFDVFTEASRQSAERSKKGDDFSDLQLFSALFDPNRPLALKRLMADQMEMFGTGSGLGPTLDTMLVQDRNEAAIKVLRREIQKGTAKIAVFYGAAHMPDFDRRLTEELKLKREAMTWERAWDLTGK